MTGAVDLRGGHRRGQMGEREALALAQPPVQVAVDLRPRRLLVGSVPGLGKRPNEVAGTAPDREAGLFLHPALRAVLQVLDRPHRPGFSLQEMELLGMFANQAAIAANKAAIAADNKRFGELADYNILNEVTVYFANGNTEIEAKYKPQLLQLAQKAKGITAYIIQVQGYASKVGSAAMNQRLSAERADHVLELLEQQGNIPLTNVLAPGAMGTSAQVAPDATVEGQAENRRVVVRVLQNKGIAGT